MDKKLSSLLQIIFSFILVLTNSYSVYAVNPDSFFVVSDSSWKYSDTEVTGWKDQGFDDSGLPFSKSPSTGLCGGIDVILPQSRITQNGAQPMWTQTPVNHSTAYFRKVFTLDSPAIGSVRAVFDDDGEVYINGHLVVQSVNSGFVKDILTADVSPYLTVGNNVIAIRGVDTQGGCQSVQFELSVSQNVASVPEFGRTTGILTLLCSIGVYMFMKSKQFIG